MVDLERKSEEAILLLGNYYPHAVNMGRSDYLREYRNNNLELFEKLREENIIKTYGRGLHSLTPYGKELYDKIIKNTKYDHKAEVKRLVQICKDMEEADLRLMKFRR